MVFESDPDLTPFKAALHELRELALNVPDCVRKELLSFLNSGVQMYRIKQQSAVGTRVTFLFEPSDALSNTIAALRAR